MKRVATRVSVITHYDALPIGMDSPALVEHFTVTAEIEGYNSGLINLDTLDDLIALRAALDEFIAGQVHADERRSASPEGGMSQGETIENDNDDEGQ